ncbi:hypothetical protein K457DRAFT_26603 [Linnemannia elongata AG-77]|uniref:Uncharacterized protein n=1 Tax=Linnemannia elongata AG-77 TaxID=1314771 RepID=A0A197JA19_9FUNG|nr:hypothetical protein K457DRAFT_26603 [Linnemannia elongata AG-77]
MFSHNILEKEGEHWSDSAFADSDEQEKFKDDDEDDEEAEGQDLDELYDGETEEELYSSFNKNMIHLKALRESRQKKLEGNDLDMLKRDTPSRSNNYTNTSSTTLSSNQNKNITSSCNHAAAVSAVLYNTSSTPVFSARERMREDESMDEIDDDECGYEEDGSVRVPVKVGDVASELLVGWKPTVHHCFKSRSAADVFLRSWALKKGHKLIIRTSTGNAVKYVCSFFGFYKSKKVADED